MIGRLVLGTAALGLDNYGLANRTGKPSRAVAFEILDRAFAAGVRWVDTAAAYGDAETLLGEYGLPRHVQVVSKLRPNLFDEAKPATVGEVIISEGLDSCRRLGVARLDVYLLHSSRYVFRPDVLAALVRVRERGFAERVGVSCYGPAEIDAAVAAGLDAVQAPYSALDRRCEAAMASARARGLLVFARAPFLQGLLVLPPEDVPERLAAARPHVERWYKFARQYGADEYAKANGRVLSWLAHPAELPLEFALQNPYADYVVFGAETPEQVDEDLAYAASPRLRGVRRAVQATVPQPDAAVVNPSLWAKS